MWNCQGNINFDKNVSPLNIGDCLRQFDKKQAILFLLIELPFPGLHRSHCNQIAPDCMKLHV